MSNDSDPAPAPSDGSPDSGFLSYREVAARIEAVFGERPSLSSLRAAVAAERRSPARSRVTAGMPPSASSRPGHPALFDPAAIDAWLADHPRHRTGRLLDELGATPDSRRGPVAARARAAGATWSQIVDAINAADGTTLTRQWAHQRFGSSSAATN